MTNYSITYWQRMNGYELSDRIHVQADSIEEAFKNAELQLMMAGIEYSSFGCIYELEPKPVSLFDQLATLNRP